MDVTVIGCGYVGLVTGTCLASIGHTVRGVEKDARKLKTLLDGHCPIFEPGLQELMQENYASGQLQFTENVKAAVKDAEVVFLCVGTPPKPDGTVDMSFLEGAGKEVCDALGLTLPDIAKAESETVAGLEAAKGYIRFELKERMGVRHVPDLAFFADRKARQQRHEHDHHHQSEQL